jgi:hypothetical protein
MKGTLESKLLGKIWITVQTQIKKYQALHDEGLEIAEGFNGGDKKNI